MKQSARAVACANIALAKYWGKADTTENLPAVPSLSLTLDGLDSDTQVVFDSELGADEVWLDRLELSGRPRQRVVCLLDCVRKASGLTLRARVTSRNSFPTASGLASSASGFAALALAASRAAGLDLGQAELSSLARSASASAARSIWGGFVALEAQATSAEPLAAPDHWPVVMVIAVVDSGGKPIGSTEAMNQTRATSPYYEAWVKSAPATYRQIRDAVLKCDIEALGDLMEHSALCMHASMLGARPYILYPKPASLRVIELVRTLRDAGTPVFFTMDAGPQVKLLTLPEHSDQVERAVAALPEVAATLKATPGPDARIVDDGREA